MTALMAALGAHDLRASVAPNTQSATITNAGTATTGASTVTAAGGSGSYLYSWSTPGFTATTPGAASTTFSKALSNGQDFTATATCTVTDRQTGDQVTVTVGVHLTSTAAFGADLTGNNWPHPAGANSAQSVTLTAVPHDNVGACTFAWSVGGGLGGVTISGSSSSASCTFNVTMGPDNSQFWGTSVSCHVVDTGTSNSVDIGDTINQTPS